MALDKEALFHTTVALWAEVVDLSNGLQALNDIYWKNEKSFPDNDHWRRIALWSFHQALFHNARKALALGRWRIMPRLLRQRTFERWVLFNLNGDEDWSTELAEFGQMENLSGKPKTAGVKTL